MTLIADDLIFAHPGQAMPYRFSLTVAPGRIAAVTGPSGAGKSTLLDLIAGFLTPQGGTLTLDDRNLLPLGPEARPVSILFQSDNLFDHLTARANLALALPGTDRKTQASRIDTALEEVGLNGYAPRRAANLSGGQKQRVALARTLLIGRPILLLDEPFTALDAATAGTIRALVRTLVRERNWHAVMVTHQPADLDIADAVFALDNGTLKATS